MRTFIPFVPPSARSVEKIGRDTTAAVDNVPIVRVPTVRERKKGPARMDRSFGQAVGQRVTLPALMQEVQALTRLAVPDTTARTRWMFGSQRRLVFFFDQGTL